MNPLDRQRSLTDGGNPDVRSDDKKLIKCIVWDLDNTLWRGVLLEDRDVSLHDNVVDIIRTLDKRGILHSIASKNDYVQAMTKLKSFGLHEYFLYPQINWNSKVASLRTIAQSINIGLDAIALIDDQPFERAEVTYSLPEVLCIDAADLNRLVDYAAMNPPLITEDSQMRRLMYLSDFERKKAEEEFVGPQEEFLATLEMVFTISSATQEDMRRVEELVLRTNQLNTTGYLYAYNELDRFRQSERYKLLVTSLQDKYGRYGKIGIALIECQKDIWIIKLLLMSCRVMSRGVGTILLSYIMKQAKSMGIRLQAEFVSNDRNRMMYITYKFSGFKETHKIGDVIILESDLEQIQPFPEFIKVQIID